MSHLGRTDISTVIRGRSQTLKRSTLQNLCNLPTHIYTFTPPSSNVSIPSFHTPSKNCPLNDVWVRTGMRMSFFTLSAHFFLPTLAAGCPARLTGPGILSGCKMWSPASIFLMVESKSTWCIRSLQAKAVWRDPPLSCKEPVNHLIANLRALP